MNYEVKVCRFKTNQERNLGFFLNMVMTFRCRRRRGIS